jgi:hypothetical protein
MECKCREVLYRNTCLRMGPLTHLLVTCCHQHTLHHQLPVVCFKKGGLVVVYRWYPHSFVSLLPLSTHTCRCLWCPSRRAAY